MTTPQLARIDEHLRKLRLYKLRERLGGPAPGGERARVLLCRLPRPAAQRRGGQQARQAGRHAHGDGPIPPT